MTVKEKHKHRNPKDKHYKDTARIRQKRVEINTMKVAMRKIQYLLKGHPAKGSYISILSKVNELHSSNISVKTTFIMVREGQIGVLHL